MQSDAAGSPVTEYVLTWMVMVGTGGEECLVGNLGNSGLKVSQPRNVYEYTRAPHGVLGTLLVASRVQSVYQKTNINRVSPGCRKGAVNAL